MFEFSWAEVYFIAIMMVVIMIGSVAAVYIFIRQYRREKAFHEAERQLRREQKAAAEQAKRAAEPAE